MTPHTAADGTGRFVVFDEPVDIWRAMTDRWREIATEAVRERGVFTAALSGGRTPLGFYCFLKRATGLPWEKTDLFQVDERFVPAGDEDSNFRMIDLSLLLRADTAPCRVHPVPTDAPSAAAAAERYEALLREYFNLPTRSWPSFDLILLGMGEDGHTASLFPGSKAVEEKERWVVSVAPKKAAHDRITLTFPVLNRGRHVFFMATGSSKAGVVRQVGQREDPAVPASLVRPRSGNLTFFLERSAGALIEMD